MQFLDVNLSTEAKCADQACFPPSKSCIAPRTSATRRLSS